MVLTPAVLEDARGFFAEVYRPDQFRELRLPETFGQWNHSRSARNVLRGLPFQWDPPMAKERGEAEVLDNKFVSPLYTPDIVNQLAKFSQTDGHGLVCATSNGRCSSYEFAGAIFRLTRTKVELLQDATSKFPTKVSRPRGLRSGKRCVEKARHRSDV